MSDTITLEHTVHWHARGRGRRELRPLPAAVPAAPVRSVPRLARLMALALRCDALVRSGEVQDHATLARLAHITRARVSQILTLVHLAPDIQEQILFLEGSPRGRDALLLRHVQPIATLADWQEQRRRWRTLRGRRQPLSAGTGLQAAEPH